MKAFYRCNPDRAMYLPLISDMVAKNIPAIFIMIQTTGLKPEGDEPDEIVQLTAIKAYPSREAYEGGNVGDLIPVDCLSYYFHPSKHMSDETSRRNGISRDLLESAPYVLEKAEELRNFFSQPAVFVAHNVNFVRKFFDALALGTGICLVPYAYIDTSELARDVIKPGFINSYGYRELFRFYNISLYTGDTNIVNTYGLVMLTNKLIAEFREKTPVCGYFRPVIQKMEYLDKKQENDLVQLRTEYGDVFFNCATQFWEDPYDGILIRFFDMDDLEKRAFENANAADGTEFVRRMCHLITVSS